MAIGKQDDGENQSAIFIQKKGDEIWVKKDLADRTVRFINHNRLIAKAVPEGWVPPKSNRVAIHRVDAEFDLDIYEMASIYYIFLLKN